MKRRRGTNGNKNGAFGSIRCVTHRKGISASGAARAGSGERVGRVSARSTGRTTRLRRCAGVLASEATLAGHLTGGVLEMARWTVGVDAVALAGAVRARWRDGTIVPRASSIPEISH